MTIAKIRLTASTREFRRKTERDLFNLGVTKIRIMRKQGKSKGQPCADTKMTVTKKQCGMAEETV